MRKPMLTSLALACGAVLFSAAASAIPISVGLTGAGGHHGWQTKDIGDPHGRLTLIAYVWDDANDDWTCGVMGVNTAGLGVTGFGASPAVGGGQTPSGGQIWECGSGSVNAPSTNSYELIDMNISDFTDWIGLTIDVGGAGNGTAMLFGATCGPSGSCLPLVAQPLDGSCDVQSAGQGSGANTPTFNGTALSGSVTCSTQQLSDFSHLWLVSAWDDDTPALLGSTFDLLVPDATSVPEPSALGIFGFGALLIGWFAGLRRRRVRARRNA